MSFTQSTRESLFSDEFKKTILRYLPPVYLTMIYSMYIIYKIFFAHQVSEVIFVRFIAKNNIFILAWAYLIAQTLYTYFNAPSKKLSAIIEKDIEKGEKESEIDDEEIRRNIERAYARQTHPPLKKLPVIVEEDVVNAEKDDEKDDEQIRRNIERAYARQTLGPYILVTKFHTCEIYLAKHPFHQLY